MPGSQIATSVTIISSGLKGYQAISLTEFDTSAESAIAAGSTVEIAGAFFIFSTEESVTGFSAITTATSAYLALTPSGSAGSQIVNASWTDTAPVWVTSKAGWYASADSVVRVVAVAGKSSPTSSQVKGIFTQGQMGVTAQLVMEIGSWNMNSSAAGSATKFLYPGINYANVLGIKTCIIGDNGYQDYESGTSRLYVFYQTDTTPPKIYLYAVPGSQFDAVNYDSTAVNRGWIIIDYVI